MTQEQSKITNTTKEVENMTRKAETLKSLDELNLSTRTRSYIKNKFDSSIDQVVKEGRVLAFFYEKHPETHDKEPKWKSQLICALNETGFIRPANDFSLFFAINVLYGAVYGCWDELITTIDQLTNEQYEDLQGFTEPETQAIKDALLSRLTAAEFKIISYRFGLDNGHRKSLENCAENLNMSRERVRYIEAKALRKLRSGIKLPPILISPSSECDDEVNSIIREIEELRKNPIYQKEARLRQQLRTMSNTPFKYSEKAQKYLDGGMSDFTDIERLNFTIRPYNCLKRANINTVADIIKFQDWTKVRNLTRRNLLEIVNKIHSIGYTDFSIDLLS